MTRVFLVYDYIRFPQKFLSSYTELISAQVLVLYYFIKLCMIHFVVIE